MSSPHLLAPTTNSKGLIRLRLRLRYRLLPVLVASSLYSMPLFASQTTVAAIAPVSPTQLTATDQVTGTTESVSLTLSPELCAIEKNQKSCQQKIKLTWLLSAQASPCLYRADLDRALQCWQHETDGQTLLSIDTNKDLAFQLKENETVLAQAVFRVLWEAQQRRKRHKPWQFF